MGAHPQGLLQPIRGASIRGRLDTPAKPPDNDGFVARDLANGAFVIRKRLGTGIFHRPRRFPGSWLVPALLVLGGLALARGQESQPPEEAAEPTLPPLLRGVDLNQPAAHAFREWPQADLIERPYWHGWNARTFQRAELYDRPLLLVLAVPWNRLSQRMLTETLADKTVLREVNAEYLSVLVSADRRPDVRERYQTGTWPAISLLLPNGNPMLSHANPSGYALPITVGFLKPDELLFVLEEGGIYYRKWRNVLHGVGEVWQKREGDVEAMPGAVKDEASDQVARWLLGNVDRSLGGFGAAPKFVAGGLAEYAAVRDARLAPALVEVAKLTLEKLVAGPLYDKRDGGVHRLAAAPAWGDIQYEKMLESNTELLRDLTFALRAADAPSLRSALSGTAGFVTKILARPGGGFYLAQAADPSSDDGGAYWTSSGEARKAPPVERLVLAGPNAMAGAALLRASAILGDDAMERAGRDALDLVLRAGFRSGRGVRHVLEPNPEDRSHLTAQADVAFALIDAYETTGDARYRDAARDIVDYCRNNMVAKGETSLRDILPGPGQLGLLVNPRRPILPNVRLARASIRLARHGLGDVYRDAATTIVGSYSGDLAAYHVHGIEPALAVEELVRTPVLLRVDGPPADPRTKALRRAAAAAPAGWAVVVTGSGPQGTEPTLVILAGEAHARVTSPGNVASEVRRVTRTEGRQAP
jgi:uncharacterized protein YyaL (SSP411 family)